MKKNICYRTGKELNAMISRQELNKPALIKFGIDILAKVDSNEILGMLTRRLNAGLQKNLNDNVILDQVLLDKIDEIAARTACSRSDVVRHLLCSACLKLKK